MPHNLVVRAVIALLLAATIGVSTTGCVGNIIESAIERETGGDIQLGGGLAEGWPAEVPVIDGDVVYSTRQTDEGSGEIAWVAMIAQQDGESESALRQAATLLENAGFTPAEGVDTLGSDYLMAYQNANWNVAIAGEQSGVMYTVTARTG